MKTISFFNEKGGVGKSTFTILYASWLYDRMGVNVGVADFEQRIQGYRDEEIRQRNLLIKNRLKEIESNPDLPEIQPLDESMAWPIITVENHDIVKIKKQGYIQPYSEWLKRETTKGKLANCDVVLCDFGGTLDDDKYIEIASDNYLSLVVVPVEKDQMTLQATIKTQMVSEGKNLVYFVTKARLAPNLKNGFIKYAQKLNEIGMRVLPDMVSYSERITTIEKLDITRSTFYYPDYENNVAFKGLSDLGIENLFIDITRELLKAKDIPGTGRADLSRINEFVKKNDGRNFTGSSFPQYEI